MSKRHCPRCGRWARHIKAWPPSGMYLPLSTAFPPDRSLASTTPYQPFSCFHGRWLGDIFYLPVTFGLDNLEFL